MFQRILMLNLLTSHRAAILWKGRLEGPIRSRAEK